MYKVFFLLFALPLWAESSTETYEKKEKVLLQGLEKVTARVFMIEAVLDEPLRFGHLTITLKQCRKAPPEETPESIAFLTIDEDKPDGKRVSLFSGWMFSSNPSVSALEHPVYDVWVKDCISLKEEVKRPPVVEMATSKKEEAEKPEVVYDDPESPDQDE